jgi:hypothetical protein
VALHDAIKGCGLPVIEVHISNVHARESFRHHSFVSPVAKGTIIGLGVHGYELAIKGGENGSTIVPGKPVDSLAIQRIELPADDDEHMPPDGKEQATAEELALLKWWVQEGASDKLKVSEAKFPVELKPVVDAALKSVAGAP